jgi:hypothetical protein
MLEIGSIITLMDMENIIWQMGINIQACLNKTFAMDTES